MPERTDQAVTFRTRDHVIIAGLGSRFLRDSLRRCHGCFHRDWLCDELGVSEGKASKFDFILGFFSLSRRQQAQFGREVVVSSRQSKYQVRIDFRLRAALRKDYGASDFLQSISGRILAREGSAEIEQRVGYVNASLVQFGTALDYGISPDQLGDGISGAIAEYWEQLFDVETGCWKEEIRDEFEIGGSDLLIVDYMEITPQLRGQGLGLMALDRTVDIFGTGCGLVACRPSPRQFSSAYGTNRRRLQRWQPPPDDEEQAVRKLRLYWSRAGFWPLGHGGVYVMGMSQRRAGGSNG